MPYGAHETMEVHEILMEKIHMIAHCNLYAQETNNPQILDMIARHQQAAIASYNELVSYTRGGGQFQPLPPNTDIQGVSRQQIRYGVQNMAPMSPQAGSKLSDRDICAAMLIGHKNGARNCASASLECADPNLRRILLNSAAVCADQAYEVFLYMNEQGLYPVPTLSQQSAESFLQRYQPADRSLQSQYAGFGGGMEGGGMQAGAMSGYGYMGSGPGMDDSAGVIPAAGANPGAGMSARAGGDMGQPAGSGYAGPGSNYGTGYGGRQHIGGAPFGGTTTHANEQQ